MTIINNQQIPIILATMAMKETIIPNKMTYNRNHLFHYTTKLGKRILEKDDEWVWPIAGVDYQYEI